MLEEKINKPVDIEPNKAKELISSLSIYIPEQYAEVKKAIVDHKTSNELNRVVKAEELRIQTIEFYGLMIFTFSAVETYITAKQDIIDYNKYIKILLIEDLDLIRQYLDELKEVSLRLAKNTGLSTLAPLSKVNEIREQIDLTQV